jgi:hypothetical protein
MANVIYIPWSLPLAQEFLLKSQQWVNSEGDQKHTRNWQIVMNGDPGAPLSSLPFGSTIYVRGHGAPGDHSLDADNHGNGSIKYDQVCDRMIADGLKRSFAGTIKFSCCNSGVPGFGAQSFAAKASQYFRFSKGYMLISFVGYMGAVDSEYNFDSDTHRHRYVTVFGKEIKSKWAQIRF